MQIQVNRIIHIGKESNKLEESNVLGVDENGYQIYDEDNGFLTDKVKEFIENVTPGISRRYGICRNELYLLRTKVKEGVPLNLQPKTLTRLRTMLEALGIAS